MSGSNGGGEKTEKPTQKKLQDSAKKGDILQSKELATALVVMAGIGWIAVTGPSVVESLSQMLVEALRFRREDITDFAPAARGMNLLTGIALPVGAYCWRRHWRRSRGRRCWARWVSVPVLSRRRRRSSIRPLASSACSDCRA